MISSHEQKSKRLTSPVATGVILGIGVMSFVDEAVFHELLQWHSVYWSGDQQGRILSDGVLRAASALVILRAALQLRRDPASWTACPSDFTYRRCPVYVRRERNSGGDVLDRRPVAGHTWFE